LLSHSDTLIIDCYYLLLKCPVPLDHYSPPTTLDWMHRARTVAADRASGRASWYDAED